MAELADFQNLAIATAIGLLIGFQREWRDVELEKQRTFAGARTFALTGFVGGLAGIIGDGGVVLVALGLAAVAGLAIAAYWAEARDKPGAGGTTEVAVIATYLLGALATRGDATLAAAGGVLVAILLALKPLIQRLTQTIDAAEIEAALRFLAISVIVLPILPNEGFGPYQALNPRQIWWLVVLISGLSFLGYWLTKLFGARGVLLTGLVGGLASSTATTLSLSRLVRNGTTSARAGAAGIIAANVVMMARVVMLLSAVSVNVLQAIWPALAAGALVGLVAAALFWRRETPGEEPVRLGNPMELRPALVFAALLAFVALASRFASEAFGDRGVYALAFVTGFGDVDAISLTAAGQARSGGLSPETAGGAVLIAVASNIVVKAALARWVAGPGAGLRVGAAFAVILAAGAAAASAVFS